MSSVAGKFWAGKLIGALIGFVSGGPFGLLVGAFAGHLFDQALSKVLLGQAAVASGSAGRAQIQQVFFRATFRVMGRLAKADGRVSEQEIDAASHIMNQMGLSGPQRQAAINFFTEGKNPQLNLASDLSMLRNLFTQRTELAQMFMEIQLSVAYADGKLSVEERKLFDKLCRDLGISVFQFEWIHGRIQAAMNSGSRGYSSGYQGRPGQQNSGSAVQLKNAYAVLGVKADASDDELKKAYRKLMSQHHPDKLIAKGLPEEMMKLAKEKTQEIQTAYDLVRKARK
ncbi:MAG: co-chaperone DjlA [Oceanospirillaceae bacterium]|uniref:co-chaperone DjlA n=3 Tax=unclassified Thalassolituus TaxID=2624967 RepID=UPI000C08E233|nr:co-chaperone DjlA [Thalassolituus sp. UBA6592]MAK90307.1 co-chaperone DjlA [Thalassolituus sp.]MAS24625.1 co-chaperone DjlA [Oceanospirillaceae bacterium]MAX97610.1 co-chaperone DjlA [Oceanospirillaceae bacterium]MBS52596.1 co-chaperone DjlA [Oceanospirillaceae bacterium]|tara:strand:+ start:1959 stop:2810 length:852 start_codon:yes stop_codon:yes gene_type:complete